MLATRSRHVVECLKAADVAAHDLILDDLLPDGAVVGLPLERIGEHGVGGVEPAREVLENRAPLRALHSYVHSLRDTVRELPAVTQPVLLLRSAVDHVVPPKSSDLLLARISSKDVTTIVLERSYHVATLDHDAETIERESLAFVRRVAA